MLAARFRTLATASLIALGLSASCDIDLGPLEPPPPPPCNPRIPFYPDTNGDGVGEQGTIYIGCEAPPGYVALAPPADTDVVDTDPTDTDASDTDGTDTDGGGT